MFVLVLCIKTIRAQKSNPLADSLSKGRRRQQKLVYVVQSGGKRQTYMGVEFAAKSACLATYGSWLLMQIPRYNLYIVNLFTNERINLPPVESQVGMVKVERTLDGGIRISYDQSKYIGINIRSHVFCIDGETKDYAVIWALSRYCVVYAKKGDTSWTQIPETSYCLCMVYKDHKLYFLSYSGSFKIFAFSRETFQFGVIVNSFELGRQPRQPSTQWSVFATKLVVTVTGDVLKVERMIKYVYRLWSFRVYKVYSSGLTKNYEKVNSLGGEALLWDLGTTVLANDIDGFERNSIYFSCIDDNLDSTTCLFYLETQKAEPLCKFDCSLQQLGRTRWFLPSFKRRC